MVPQQEKLLSRFREFEYVYTSATGRAVGRVLTAFRDEKKILGLKCPQCGKVTAPAQDYCEFCAVDMDEWVEVAQEGKVITWAVMHRDLPIYPHKVPFAYVLIQLDGADTALLHTILAKDYSAITEGARVKAVWKEEREGAIRDIDHFELV
jgi:uncharacterized OB-fold protein